MNKREKISLILAVMGIVWYFAENFYFGWHKEAQSPLEGAADFMIWVFLILAYFIRPTRVEIHHHPVNAQNVKIINPKVELQRREEDK